MNEVGEKIFAVVVLVSIVYTLCAVLTSIFALAGWHLPWS